MKREKHKLIGLGIAFVFATLWGWQSLAILTGMFLGVKGYRYFSHPLRKAWEEIAKDAKYFQAIVPASPKVQEKLVYFYTNMNRSLKRNPDLSPELFEIKDAFWQEISGELDSRKWLMTLDTLERNWPNLEMGESGLMDKLDQFQQMSSLYKKSHIETKAW